MVNISTETITTAETPVPLKKRRKNRTLERMVRNPSFMIGALIVLLMVVAGVFAPILAPYPPNQINFMALLQPPSGAHWFGTDELGRDLFSRILYGARTSLEVSAASVGIGLFFGILIGLLTGYIGGAFDEWFVMRVMDSIQSFPFLILALVIGAVLGSGLGNAMIAIGFGFIPGFVRIVRAQVFVQKRSEYVQSAITVGAGTTRILVVHILPNILTPIIVQATLGLASGVVAEAGLSYLGLGVQPPAASWGAMLHTAQGYITTAPWLAIFPGLTLAISVLGFNYLGDGLADLWQPKRN